MFDYSCLLHGVFAFFIPGAWALVLYPFFRFCRKDWRHIIVFAVFFAAISMYVKEKFDPVISVNDITADLLGVFLGTALVAAVLTLKDRRFSKEALVFKKDFSLRGFLSVAERIEQLAVGFYTNASRNMQDEGARELCLKIAFKERGHVDNVKAILGKWQLKDPDPMFAEWVDKELYRRNIFTVTIAGNAAVRHILEYAIEQHRRIGDFYLDCRVAFPDEWKRDHIQKLVDAEREHETELRVMLRRAA